MKVFGFIDNYGGEGDEQAPSLIQFSDVSVIGPGKPFFVPGDGHVYRAYPSVAIRVGRLGKTVSPRFAGRYYSEAAFGMNVRDESMLADLRKAGLPWTEAVAFDYSVPLGTFMPASRLLSEGVEVRVSMTDREGALSGQPLSYFPDMLKLKADEALSRLSRRFTIKNGDVVLLGFPPAGLDISVGQTIVCSVGDEVVLKTKIR